MLFLFLLMLLLLLFTSLLLLLLSVLYMCLTIIFVRQRKADFKNNAKSSNQDDIIKMMLNYEIDELKDENDPAKRMTG